MLKPWVFAESEETLTPPGRRPGWPVPKGANLDLMVREVGAIIWWAMKEEWEEEWEEEDAPASGSCGATNAYKSVMDRSLKNGGIVRAEDVAGAAVE